MSRALRFAPWLAALALWSSVGWAQVEVQLPVGLRPGVDRLLRIESESRQTVSVVEDRGFLAKGGGRFPASMVMIQRQTMRHTTTPAAADGTYGLRMEFLSRSSTIQMPGGVERTVPDDTGLTGAVITARVEPDGRIRPDSYAVQGMPPEHAETLRPMLASVLDQLQTAGGVKLIQGVPVPKKNRLSIPLPGLPKAEMDVLTTMTLQRVTNGVAEIDAVISMTLGMAASTPMLKATGSGSGSITYSVEPERVDRSRIRMNMSFDINLPDGLLRIESVSDQSSAMVDLPR